MWVGYRNVCVCLYVSLSTLFGVVSIWAMDIIYCKQSWLNQEKKTQRRKTKIDETKLMEKRDKNTIFFLTASFLLHFLTTFFCVFSRSLMLFHFFSVVLLFFLRLSCFLSVWCIDEHKHTHVSWRNAHEMRAKRTVIEGESERISTWQPHTIHK